ncbi:DsbA family protein [Silvanigrella aquatica]|uniref:Thioredoxin-like fold domain-containing protein n=1 Tax=Silvanigrella aquatica TaxID=1915309 RepID=A0A1L4CYY6_9BACT|nr:thioredoxin domain-containing protein [Silvanigrella aquatica]APJ03164.1 hypothetical protein AXG55_04295 [Silvanigrella aquatica]
MEENKLTKTSTAKVLGFFVGGLLLGSLATAGVMISKNNKKAADLSAVVGKPILSVDGKTWDTTSLPGEAGMDYFTLQSNIYNAEKNFAGQVAARIALANDSGKKISPTELPKIDELLPVAPVSEQDAKQYYEKVVAQMGNGVFGGQSFDKVKSQLQMQMTQQTMNEAIMRKIQELESTGRIKVLLSAPLSPPVKLDLAGYPVRGNQNSNTVLVEVSDYLCAHCRETEKVIEKIYDDFSSKVKFVNVTYPLNPQGLSGALARGAFCATKQGGKQFRDYHSLAFQISFSKATPPAGVEPTKAFDNESIEIAKQAKLDVPSFSSCLTSNEANEHLIKVQNQFNSSIGFKGTPTFYLNGRLIDVNPQQLEATLKTALN